MTAGALVRAFVVVLAIPTASAHAEFTTLYFEADLTSASYLHGDETGLVSDRFQPSFRSLAGYFVVDTSIDYFAGHSTNTYYEIVDSKISLGGVDAAMSPSSPARYGPSNFAETNVSEYYNGQDLLYTFTQYYGSAPIDTSVGPASLSRAYFQFVGYYDGTFKPFPYGTFDTSVASVNELQLQFAMPDPASTIWMYASMTYLSNTPSVAAPVPEPQTYGMWVVGLGLLAYARWRKSSKSRT